MEFTEEHAKHLLSKEWLAKSDPSSSTPYLIKFHSFDADLLCCILVTDTKSVWTEVLTAQQLARRWRSLNRFAPEPMSRSTEDLWREQTLRLLADAHTIGGIAELSFQVVETQYSDFAFELECEAFKWRWETTFLGYKLSSEIISKHLIFPLISLNHLTFSSSEPMGALPESEIEQAVDKLGRTARRTVETHIKNAFSKPRVATAIRRMTAILNFVPDCPPVISTAEKPPLEVKQLEPETRSPFPQLGEQQREARHDSSPKPVSERHSDKRERIRSVTPDTKPVQSDSATESDEHEPMNTSRHDSIGAAGPTHTTVPIEIVTEQSHRAQTPNSPVNLASESESSPHRPAKKAKARTVVSSDEDSGETKNKAAQGRVSATGAAKTRGTRQPIKRGAKRF